MAWRPIDSSAHKNKHSPFSPKFWLLSLYMAKHFVLKVEVGEGEGEKLLLHKKHKKENMTNINPNSKNLAKK